MKNIYLTALVLTMGLTSCDGLLDLTPKSEISQDDYFKTESDLQLSVTRFTTTCWTRALSTTRVTCTCSRIFPTRCWAETTVPCLLRAGDGHGPTCAR